MAGQAGDLPALPRRSAMPCKDSHRLGFCSAVPSSPPKPETTQQEAAKTTDFEQMPLS